MERSSASAIEQNGKSIAVTAIYVVVVVLLGVLFANGSIGDESDKIAYSLYFEAINQHLGLPLDFARVEPGFYALTWLIAQITDSVLVYFWIIFVLQFIGLTCRTGKASPLFSDRFYLALLWLAFPFFYSLSLNVLRQGIALIFVLYAIDAELNGRRLRGLLLLVGGMLFHASTLAYLLVFVVLRSRVSLRVILLIWIACVACAAAALPQQIIAMLASLVPGGIRQQYPYYFSYLTGQLAQNYDPGFKLRFLLFSALPLLAWLLLGWAGLRPLRDAEFVLKLYLLLNAIFFFFGYIPFSDRIALLSWQLMPVLAVGLTPFKLRAAASLTCGVAALGMLTFILFI